MPKEKLVDKFYEIKIQSPNKFPKKQELNVLYDLLDMHWSLKYLIVDRLFINLKYCDNLNLSLRSIRLNIGDRFSLEFIEQGWTGDLLKLFNEEPIATQWLKTANEDQSVGSHDWTFDELLVKVTLAMSQEKQRMEDVALDALTKAPPPMIIIKTQTEIEELKTQYGLTNKSQFKLGLSNESNYQ